MKRVSYASRASRRALLCASVGLSLAFLSCYPGEITSIQDLDIVATFHDPDADFAANRTYVIPDSVIHLGEILDIEDNIELDREHDELILSEVADNLEALGYVEELDPENNPPDVIVLVAAVASENWIAYVSYPWWGYWGWYPYWPCCGPGWGIGYPWAPVVGTTSYEAGTVFVDMVDPDVVDVENEVLGTLWVGALNGILGSSSATTATRLSDGINQMFAQSPYLATREPR